ncbi:MAG: fumarylacetoacetate hydrolase family protein, partial [Microbacteriaceae bacterium]
QYRTLQWLQGKTFENSSPFGPYLVTPDEFRLGATLTTTVDGEVMQESSTADLIFTPTTLISYFSRIVTLNPGDVIATGTPGGVGHARKPPRYLTGGSTLTTTIDGLGTQTNRALAG